MSIADFALAAVWLLAGLSQAAPVQQSDVDRLQATSVCAEHVRTIGPRLVKWRQDEAKAAKEPSGVEWSFSGHYNGELRRCLVEVKSTFPTLESKSEKPLAIVSWIYDALEGQFIAKIFSIRDRKDAKQRFITTCDIFNEPKAETECRSLMQR